MGLNVAGSCASDFSLEGPRGPGTQPCWLFVLPLQEGTHSSDSARAQRATAASSQHAHFSSGCYRRTISVCALWNYALWWRPVPYHAGVFSWGRSKPEPRAPLACGYRGEEQPQAVPRTVDHMR